MRFKENRIAGKNKDGSDDMRFRQNRVPGKNKDGSDDMRYTINKLFQISEQNDEESYAVQSLKEEN